jgi:BirA family biotin operon repressor/biotin-[acetyl-CoA-carboxylase] ligase
MFILELLESKRGQHISGEDIARRLNISRNSVWKAMKDLEKDGYRIDAATNKGYSLCEDNDIVSVQGILPFLSKKELSNNIHVYESLQSTNKTAKERAVSGAEHGTVIIADCQTEGKGRYGRKFYSPPGHGLYMSLILRPERIWFATPTLITAFAAVSVCESIEAITEKAPQIKWVNDIYLNGLKVCGILTEAVTDLESGNIQWIVAGIGLNVSTPDFPKELNTIAGAVFASVNPSATRNRFAAEIINRMVTPEYQYGNHEMLDQYKKRLMMLGDKVLICSPQGEYTAVAVDIDETGRLIVKKDDGEIAALSSGEISVSPKLS